MLKHSLNISGPIISFQHSCEAFGHWALGIWTLFSWHRLLFLEVLGMRIQKKTALRKRSVDSQEENASGKSSHTDNRNESAVQRKLIQLANQNSIIQRVYNDAAGRGQFWQARNALPVGSRNFDPTDLPAEFQNRPG